MHQVLPELVGVLRQVLATEGAAVILDVLPEGRRVPEGFGAVALCDQVLVEADALDHLRRGGGLVVVAAGNVGG